MNLTEHFTLEEFTASATARRYRIPNMPNDSQRRNLLQLCIHNLEPLRSMYGGPILVTSGFRSPALNARIGGSSHSQHLLGQAADITAVVDTPRHLADAQTLLHNANLHLFTLIADRLPFDQLIWEVSPTHPVPSRNPRRDPAPSNPTPAPDWVHVSFRSWQPMSCPLPTPQPNSQTLGSSQPLDSFQPQPDNPDNRYQILLIDSRTHSTSDITDTWRLHVAHAR